MQIHVTYDRPEGGPGSGPVRVGWLLTDPKAGIWRAPTEWSAEIVSA